MSILTGTNLAQSFGALDVFKGISVSVPNDGKIGLVGPNGIGKTTLLLILAGLAQPASGHVHLARGKRLGYLRQEAIEAFSERENTIHEEMLTVFAGLRAQEAELAEMSARMAEGPLPDTLLEQYLAAQTWFEEAGGYEYEARIQSVLEGLGFSKEMWSMPLNILSGGQKTRALLARLLLEKPDLLILDEPTNHLDVEAVEWLETTLRLWDGALLVVSHDRYFLDRVVNTIWEMTRTHLEAYRGNYSAYLKQREERWERQTFEFQQEKERLEKELDFIRKNIAGQRTDMAKGKLKRLSRELVAIEQLGLAAFQNKGWLELGVGNVHPMTPDEAGQHLRELRGPEGRPPKLNLRLQAQHRSGDIVLRTKKLRVGYADNSLFEAQDIELWRGDCAALIGPNGTGKTTFLKTILGELTPLAGEVRPGASLKIGYFAQAHDHLDPDKTVMDELLGHKDLSIGQARGYLAQYLFRGDDVSKSIRALSGGERARLALALLALQGANFLVLDEPTNHLDIPAQEVLQEVLEQFDGTILLVTHDRYLVDRLATEVWDLRDGALSVTHGTYREFLAERERKSEEAKQTESDRRAAAKQVRERDRRSGTLTAKTAAREAKKHAEAVAELEARIADLEARLSQTGHELQQASENQAFDRIQQLSQQYADMQAELERRVAEWERLAAEPVG